MLMVTLNQFFAEQNMNFMVLYKLVDMAIFHVFSGLQGFSQVRCGSTKGTCNLVHLFCVRFEIKFLYI